MGIDERREREKERLRAAILDAARDILSEEGLDGLSMRAIAERIEYSPATIYLYFRNKDDLIREVVLEGFRRMRSYATRELEALEAGASPMAQYAALGRSYVAFALENTAHLNVMFQLPKAPSVECPAPADSGVGVGAEGEAPWSRVIWTLQRAIDEGEIDIPDAARGGLIGWALMHGLVTLYLGGHLAEDIESREEFEALVAESMRSLYEGWKARPEGGSASGGGAGRAGGEETRAGAET
ncbi:MAG: TetR/AcrR family transcriptional regulator [Gemmatimonadota bacterium]